MALFGGLDIRGRCADGHAVRAPESDSDAVAEEACDEAAQVLGECTSCTACVRIRLWGPSDASRNAEALPPATGGGGG